VKEKKCKEGEKIDKNTLLRRKTYFFPKKYLSFFRKKTYQDEKSRLTLKLREISPQTGEGGHLL